MIGKDQRLYKKALLLSYFTVVYNLLEGIVSIFVGLLAGSIALVGFGLEYIANKRGEVQFITDTEDETEQETPI